MSANNQRLPYVPCLRWKQGEYLALQRLSPAARSCILPLIEVSEVGFDFETRREFKSIDEHLAQFAHRVSERWGKDECLVDLRHVGMATRMATGEDALTFVFRDLRAKGVVAVPVVGLAEPRQVQKSVRDIARNDHRGLAVRIGVEDAAEQGIVGTAKGLVEGCNLELEECDLIVDIGAPNFDPMDGFVGILEGVIRALPHLGHWRRFALIGTAFPSSMAAVRHGLSLIPRNEWIMYKLLARQLRRSHLRVASFGDYGVSHPEVLTVDMRLVRPYASLRYAVDDGWLVARGENVRDHGFAQYRDLCNMVVIARQYSGPEFSKGDEYIYRCSRGEASTGNLTTWRWVGTNRHLELVSRDVAALGVSLGSP